MVVRVVGDCVALHRRGSSYRPYAGRGCEMNVPAILWEHSMQCFLAARIAEVEYDETVWTPADDVADWKAGRPIPQNITDEMERFTDVRLAAEDALIHTPTNDAANVRWKLAYCRKIGRASWRERACQ